MALLLFVIFVTLTITLQGRNFFLVSFFISLSLPRAFSIVGLAENLTVHAFLACLNSSQVLVSLDPLFSL